MVWSKDLKFGYILDWIVDATEQKKFLNWLAMSFGLVFTLIVKSYFDRFRFFSI